jgi:acyl-[acyl-carrier-protein] desaturase
MPVLNHWRVWDRELGPDGEKARLELDAFLDEIDAAASRFEERRDARLARRAAREG